MSNNNKPRLKLKFRLPGEEVSPKASRSLRPTTTRGVAVPTNELLASVTVKRHFDLSPSKRAVAQESPLEIDAEANDILALEMEDGFIFYTSAGRLSEDLERIDPESIKDGVVMLDTFRTRGPAARGVGDWIVRALSLLGIDTDAVVDAAVDNAKDALGDQARELIEKGASWAGTKALMWAIEKRLERVEGLYRWIGDDGKPSDLQSVAPADFNDWQPDQPILVFIHGTGSSTLGSFGYFREAAADQEWGRLYEKFGQHIYAFEHRTFSRSPIENALALATTLPAGAHLSVVTHSRGGLVGDLLCMAGLDNKLFKSYRRGDEALKQADEEDREYLQNLARVLVRNNKNKFQIERYVRVASPAQGTLLATSHLDAFLSGLLHVIGLVPYLQVSPVYAVTKRVVLQIIKNRTDPRLVPGIEAMLPASPLAALVGQAQPHENAQIAVIAGDIEGGGLLKRIGVFLTDNLFFERENNDLVVDTDSMYGGLARARGHYLFDQGEEVNHFRYFDNAHTRRALQRWLTRDKTEEISEFFPMQPKPRHRRMRAAVGPQPVVIVLPGIMGSHLKVGRKDRVWFHFFDLAFGGLEKIRIDQPNVVADEVFDMFYGDLCDYLEDSHNVRRFAYDWRLPLKDAVGALATEVNEALASTDLPVRILSHSMGGLLVRMMIARHRELWDSLMARNEARWISLGTPNRGSHSMVETLLGISDTVRKLAIVDGKEGHGLQWVLDLVAAFPGALQLLPQPGFRDIGGSDYDYYTQKAWSDFKEVNNDFWFGKKLGGMPAAELLKQAKDAWGELDEQLPNIENIVYVAGYNQQTPCGVKIDDKRKRLLMIGTLNGDGSVTHDSGLLDCLKHNDRVWYMDADHTGLTSTEKAFPALLDLLTQGETSRLPKTRPSVRGAEETFSYEAGPVHYPTEQDLARSLLGGRRPPRRRGRVRYSLDVSCRTMDLRNARDPILVGHYEGDPISGAEAQIDRYVVNGGLTLRDHLGMYADRRGTTAVVLHEPSAEQAEAGIHHGAVVIGLGKFGKLTSSALTEAVRNGVLRYLLHLVDSQGGRLRDAKKGGEVGLATLLLGYNSTTNITVDDSVQAVMRGVMEANRQFGEAVESSLRVQRLEFIELYLDVAISAAYAVRGVAKRLQQEAERLGCHIEPASALDYGAGFQPRLGAMTGFSYWPRLIVTNPAYDDEKRKPERPESKPQGAEKLKYVFLSQRARAETEELQRQPTLVENLVRNSIRDTSYQADVSRSLFHLLVPHDFKESARQTENLVLVVDGYTANLPWEMLVADDVPLVKKTALVRQLSSSRYRTQVRSTLSKTAYVVGDPSTEGFYDAFPELKQTQETGLPSLPGAEQESVAVVNLLRAQGYDVVMAPSKSRGIDVINKLFQKPYRIVHISAHGVFEVGDGASKRSGVVLSDGLFLTAAEIGQMEVVPDLVFLNCCFSGKTDKTQLTAYNRLAYSVARELIEMGVRVVVAAGWAVDDAAAKLFAETFYNALLLEGRTFGKAVHEARLRTYEQFILRNTWGAFQAYGDPGFAMDPTGRGETGSGRWKQVAPQELVASIDAVRATVPHEKESPRRLRAQIKELLDAAPKDWRTLPEVLYVLGQFYGELTEFNEAIGVYRQAIAIEDKKGLVPVKAIEQLANFEARLGENKIDEKFIQRAIDRLLALEGAAGGEDIVDMTHKRIINSERCAILGSAYKRLAKVLSNKKAKGVQEALAQSAHWYQRGEGELGTSDFNPYCAQNRLALQALLGTANLEDAELAQEAGEIALKRFKTSLDYFDVIMKGDGLLIARMIDGSLQDEAQAANAEQEIIECYAGLRKDLPESKRELDSVITQIKLLIGFVETGVTAEAKTDAAAGKHLNILATSLGHIASTLKGKRDAPRNSSAVSETGRAGKPPTKKGGVKRSELEKLRREKTEATARRKMGDFDGSLEELDNVVSGLEDLQKRKGIDQEMAAIIRAELADTWGMMGGIHRRRNEPQEALEAYKAGCEIEKIDGKGTYNLTNTISLRITLEGVSPLSPALKDDLQKAIHNLNEDIVGGWSVGWWAWVDLGQCYLLDDRPDEAAHCYLCALDKGLTRRGLEGHIAILQELADATKDTAPSIANNIETAINKLTQYTK